MRQLPARHARLLLVAPLQRIGGLLLILILVNVIFIAVWHISRIGEMRAIKSTAERLSSSLSALSAENMAKGRPLDAGWTTGNPFVLLRWLPDDYCGELAEGQAPRRGCWYFLPQQSRVLYRARFDGWRSGGDGGVQVWQLVRLAPHGGTEAAPRQVTAVELRAVDGTTQ